MFFRRNSDESVTSRSGRFLRHALDTASSPYRLFRLSFKAEGRCAIRTYIAESVPSRNVLYKPAAVLYKPAAVLLSSSAGMTGTACKWICRSTCVPSILMCGSRPFLKAFLSTLGPSAEAWVMQCIESEPARQIITDNFTSIYVLTSDLYPVVQPSLSICSSVVVAIFYKDEEAALVSLHDAFDPSSSELLYKIIYLLRYLVSETRTTLVTLYAENVFIERLIRALLAIPKAFCNLCKQSLTPSEEGKNFNVLMDDFFDELHLDPKIKGILFKVLHGIKVLLCEKGPDAIHIVYAVSPQVWDFLKQAIPEVVHVLRNFCRSVALPCSSAIWPKIYQLLNHISKQAAQAASEINFSTLLQTGIITQNLINQIIRIIIKLSSIFYTNFSIICPELLILAKKSGPVIWSVLKNFILPNLSKATIYACAEIYQSWPAIWSFIQENTGNLKDLLIAAYPEILEFLKSSASCLQSAFSTYGPRVLKIVECFFIAVSDIAPLLWAATTEIVPVLWEDVALVIMSGFLTVGPSLILAAEEVVPVLCRAQLKVAWTVWLAASEVFPISYNAIMEVLPVIMEAFGVVAPATCLATSVVARTILVALKDEVFPKMCSATITAAPDLIKAFTAVSYAIILGMWEVHCVSTRSSSIVLSSLIHAIFEVIKTSEIATLELYRVSEVVFVEAVSAYQSVYEEVLQAVEAVDFHPPVKYGPISASICDPPVSPSSNSIEPSSSDCLDLTSCKTPIPTSYKTPNSTVRKFPIPTSYKAPNSTVRKVSIPTVYKALNATSYNAPDPLSCKTQNSTSVNYLEQLSAVSFQTEFTESPVSEFSLSSEEISFVLSSDLYLPLIAKTVNDSAVAFSSNTFSLLYRCSVQGLYLCTVQGKHSFPVISQTLFPLLRKLFKILLRSISFLRQTASSFATSVFHQSVTVSVMCSVSVSLLFRVMELSLSAEYRLCILAVSAFFQLTNNDINALLWQLMLTLSPIVGHLVLQASLKLWKSFCLLVSKCWDLALTLSPPMWSFICRISTSLFDSFCLLSKDVWDAICWVSPHLWQLLCNISPHIWEFICLMSPSIWFRTCVTVSKIWTILCQLCPRVWSTLRVECPVFWQSTVNWTTFLWRNFCLYNSLLWDVLCISSSVVWSSGCQGAATSWSLACPVTFQAWNASSTTIGCLWTVARTTYPLIVKLLNETSINNIRIYSSAKKYLVFQTDLLISSHSYSQDVFSRLNTVKEVFHEFVDTRVASKINRRAMTSSIFTPFRLFIKTLNFAHDFLKEDTRVSNIRAYLKPVELLSKPSCLISEEKSTIQNLSIKLSSLIETRFFL